MPAAMRKCFLRKLLAGLLAAVLTASLLTGCSGGKKSYKIEQNTGKSPETYPYVIHLSSADLYLAAADIELLGEEEFYAGMDRLLKDMEADFEDARNVLKRYLKIEIPVIPIYTDFSGRTEYGKREELGGLYRESSMDIHIFQNWESAACALLHEYTHFLTMHCCRFDLNGFFWAEGIADYVSKICCQNRMAVEVNYGMNEETLNELLRRGAGTENGKLDLKRCYYGTAAMYRSEAAIGAFYLSVSQAKTTLTETQLRSPLMNEVSYYEAACMLEYLVDTYGEKTVFSHLDINGKQFEEVYGKTFIDLCEEWTAENVKKCKELGLQLDFLD